MNSVGAHQADMVIEPDVTGFDLSEFSRTDELAAVGEATAKLAIPEIRELLRSSTIDSLLTSELIRNQEL